MREGGGKLCEVLVRGTMLMPPKLVIGLDGPRLFPRPALKKVGDAEEQVCIKGFPLDCDGLG